MAERRMFAKTIVLSDAFLDMPLSARCLYFTLGMFADDDGFVNSPKGIMRQAGCSEDDMKVLLAKKFLLAFESGVIVIKHWRINNYLQKDRYNPTKYGDEKATLSLDENGAYQTAKALPEPMYTQEVYTQDRLGKDRLGKDTNNSADKPHGFTPPNIQDVRAYCKERGNKVDPENFWDFYQAKNWMIGKNKMKDWKAAVRTWERSEPKQGRMSAKWQDHYNTWHPECERNGKPAGARLEDIELKLEDLE